MTGHKGYIGDGVYVALEHGMIRLTTENGIEVTNTIYIEPKVWRVLKAWVECLEKANCPECGGKGYTESLDGEIRCGTCRDAMRLP